MSATLLALPAFPAFVAGVVSALLATAVLKWFSRKSGASLPRRPEDGGRLVFEGRSLIASDGPARTAFKRHHSDGDDWDRAVSLLGSEFPHLDAKRPPVAMDGQRLRSVDGRRRLCFASEAGTVAVTFEASVSAQTETHLSLSGEDPQLLTDAVRGLPFPVWVQDEGGFVSWVNSAYLELCESALPVSEGGTWPLPLAFDHDALEQVAASPTRSARVECVRGSGTPATFDVHARKTDRSIVFVAARTDARLQSENAQEDAAPGFALARWVRSELEMCQAVIDGLDEAIAVFDAGGGLALTNAAYDRLWGAATRTGGARPSLNDVTGAWLDRTAPTPTWSRFRDFARRSRDRAGWTADVVLRDGRPISCRFSPLSGGATLAGFRNPAPSALRGGTISRQSA